MSDTFRTVPTETGIKKFPLPFLFDWRIIAVSAFFLCIFLFNGIATHDDSSMYFDAIESIASGSEYNPFFAEHQKQFPLLTSPGTLYVAALLTALTGSAHSSLVLINTILYILSVLFFYNLALLIFKDTHLGLLATLFYAGNYFILSYGPDAYLTDMGGWLFYLVSLYFAVRFYREKRERFAYIAGIGIAFGVFFKESGGVGALTLLTLILASDFPFRKKISIAFFSFLPLITNATYHIWIYLTDGYHYFTRYLNVVEDETEPRSLWNLLKGFGSLFLVGFVPILLALKNGLYAVTRKNTRIRTEENVILFAIFMSSFTFLIYPAFAVRLYAIAVPFLSLLAVFGLRNIRSRVLVYGIVFTYIVSNVYMAQILEMIEPDKILMLF